MSYVTRSRSLHPAGTLSKSWFCNNIGLGQQTLRQQRLAMPTCQRAKSQAPLWICRDCFDVLGTDSGRVTYQRGRQENGDFQDPPVPDWTFFFPLSWPDNCSILDSSSTQRLQLLLMLECVKQQAINLSTTSFGSLALHVSQAPTPISHRRLPTYFANVAFRHPLHAED